MIEENDTIWYSPTGSGYLKATVLYTYRNELRIRFHKTFAPLGIKKGDTWDITNNCDGRLVTEAEIKNGDWISKL